jgi:hypothetical protein
LAKKVFAVPSGPTKVKTPAGLPLAAAWSRSVVPAGTVPFQEIVVQFGVAPAAGFASFTEETKSPESAKPLWTYSRKIRSLSELFPIGLEQEDVVQLTRRPPAMTLPALESQAWLPLARLETRRMTRPY